MSRPAPLEIHVSRMDLGVHYASLYDPRASKVLATTSAAGYDQALERIQTLKRHSKWARRRTEIKSNRPLAALALLRLIDASEHTDDAITGTAATFVPLPVADVRNILRGALIAIEGGQA